MAQNESEPNKTGGREGGLFPFAFWPAGFHILCFFVCQHLFFVNVN